MKHIHLTTISFGLGVLSLGIQIVLIRLLLEIFHGNELSIGWALAVWLLGTSIGSFILARYLQKTILWKRIFLIVLPIVMVNYLLIKFIPSLFQITTGIIPPFNQLVPISLIVILPTALLCGVLFPFATEYIALYEHHKRPKNIVIVYIWESIGSLVAALALNFILFHQLNSLQIVSLFVLTFLIPFILVRNHRFLIIMMCLFCVVLIIFSPPILQLINKSLYSPYNVIIDKDTPYGNIKLLESYDQVVSLNQGIIVYSSPDPFSSEVKTLIPLLSHEEPHVVLIAGGNLKDYLPYLAKISSLSSIVFLEKDPFMVEYQKKFIPFNSYQGNLQLDFVIDDVRNYLRKTRKSFDVVILNQPEPSTLNLNRLYSKEFYQLIKKRLHKDGLLFFSIESSENYINEFLAQYINLLSNTLRLSFKYIFIIPGAQNYFLASESSVFIHNLSKWSDRLHQYQVIPDYISDSYFNFRLSAERLQSFSEQLNNWPVSEINTDYNLKGYLYHFRLWSKIFAGNIQMFFDVRQSFRVVMVLVILLILLFLKVFIRKRSRENSLFKLFLVGFISLALEIVILLEYQIYFGTLYTGIAIIFGFFMFGLAFGAHWQGSKTLQKIFKGPVQIVNMGFTTLCIILMLLVVLKHQITLSVSVYFFLQWIFIPVIILITGIFTGKYFSVITYSVFQQNSHTFAGLTYGVDLAGGVMSALCTSIFLIPLFGIIGSLIIIFILTLFLFW